MARKANERYVRFYTSGSTAAKVEHHERRAILPEFETAKKRQPISVDPLAMVGSGIAILLAILMVVGLFQVNAVNAQVRELETQVLTLERTEAALLEQYQNGYDLEEIRIAAESMGMIPTEEAQRIAIQVPSESVEIPQLSWWESFQLALRNFFA